MNIKINKQNIIHFFWLILLILPVFIIQFTITSDFIIGVTSIIRGYLPIYLIILLILKSSSIVYPPLPGVVLTIASIPFIGWELAYIIDILGSVIGAVISFLLGKKYGSSILNKVLGAKITNKIEKTKLKQKNQIEAAIFLRFAAGGMLSDGLAWGASLIGFRLVPFVIGYAISHVVTTLPVFYFIGISTSFNSWIVFAFAAVISWIIIYKFKGRYFE